MNTITFKELKSLEYDDFIQFSPEIFQTEKAAIQIARCDLNSLDAIRVVRKVSGFAQGVGAGRIAAQICLDGDIPIHEAAWVVIDLNVHEHSSMGMDEIHAAQDYIDGCTDDKATVLMGLRLGCEHREGIEVTVMMGAKIIDD